MSQFIQNNADAMLHILEETVNMESGSYDKAGVDALGSYWKEKFEQIDFVVETVHQESRGNHYIIRHKDAINPQILILAHLDTVFPKGTVKERPFSRDETRAYGPGVIDMKASHVLLYYSMKALLIEKNNAYKNVVILFNSDEEIGSHSSRKLIEDQSKDKKYALVMEPARKNGAIVSARRGVGNYQLTVEGKAAHAGIEPENGISAIEELTYKIQKLHALSDFSQGLSVNVGLISGGISVNAVAPNARAEIDVRISSITQGEEIDAAIQDICNTPIIKGIKLSLTGGINRPPMVKTDASASLINLIIDEATKLNIELKDIATGGGSDASFTAAMGIPTVDGLGPIGGGQHSDQEYIEIYSLTERTELFINILKRLSI